MLPIAKGTKYSPSNYKYANGSNFRDLAKVVITKNTNSTRVCNSSYTSVRTTNATNKTSLPSGWYKHKAISLTGIKTLKESDWTKDGNFYFIEQRVRNNNSTGNYYVYDTAYDNYYIWYKGGKTIMWYNYKTNAWEKLK